MIELVTSLVTLAKYTKQEVFRMMVEHGNSIITLHDHKVDFGAQRLHVFKDCDYCAYCGVVSEAFYLQVHKAHMGRHKAHFNLYRSSDVTSVNPILFTQDHYLPRALGGGDNKGNLITACELCNRKKNTDIVLPLARPQLIAELINDASIHLNPPKWMLNTIVRSVQ